MSKCRRGGGGQRQTLSGRNAGNPIRSSFKEPQIPGNLLSMCWKLSQEPQRYGDRMEGAEFWPLSTLHTNVRPVPQLQYKNGETPLQKKKRKVADRLEIE